MDRWLAVVIVVLFTFVLLMRRKRLALERQQRRKVFEDDLRRRRQRRLRFVYISLCCTLHCHSLVLCGTFTFAVRFLAVLRHARKEPRSIKRAVWCKYRSKDWWNGVSSGLYGPAWRKKNLRMSELTFRLLCNELRPYISKQVCHTSLNISLARIIIVIVLMKGAYSFFH